MRPYDRCGVNMRNPHCEQMFSALLPTSDVIRQRWATSITAQVVGHPRAPLRTRFHHLVDTDEAHAGRCGRQSRDADGCRHARQHVKKLGGHRAALSGCRILDRARSPLLATSSARNTRLEDAPSIGSSNFTVKWTPELGPGKAASAPQAGAISFGRRAELI
jgi:hypothetical protein